MEPRKDERPIIRMKLVEFVRGLDENSENPAFAEFLRSLARKINEHMDTHPPEDTWRLDEDGNICSPTGGLILVTVSEER